MDSIPQSVIDAVTECSQKVMDIQAETKSKANQVRIEYREKIEPLLQERQSILDKIDGFWSNLLGATESPLKPFLNGTIDPKLLRAITSFKVTTKSKNNKLLCRTVSIVLRSNMFAEHGTFYREIDSELNTLSLEPIKWKSGTERSRSDSLFNFFSTECNDKEFIEETLEAFDLLFQNPFLILESSEE